MGAKVSGSALDSRAVARAPSTAGNDGDPRVGSSDGPGTSSKPAPCSTARPMASLCPALEAGGGEQQNAHGVLERGRIRRYGLCRHALEPHALRPLRGGQRPLHVEAVPAG